MATINYQHRTHPKSRSIRISVNANGEVVVSSPKRTSQEQIDNFVEDNINWIKKTQQKIKARKQVNQTETTIKIFGKDYKKVLTEIEMGASKVKAKDKTLKILKNKHSSKTVSQLINSFLKTTAEKYIIVRTHQFGQVMNLEFGKITLRQQKTRWGSCSSKGNLNFNWRLIHAPTEIIDYVIIHELAHLKHMNHSKAFWDLVTQYDPEHKKHRGWLKRNGMPVG